MRGQTAEGILAGRAPYPQLDKSECFHLDSLPGKKGYDLAHEMLGSRAEAVVCDFMEYAGSFEVVLFLGVLYHLTDPLGALRKVAALTKEVALIETAAIELPGSEHVSLCEFYGRDELGGDATNWWAPNMKALREMCLAAGFREVEVRAGPQPPPSSSLPRRARTAAGNVLRRFGLKEALPTGPRPYRAIVHATK